ncbi:hypothetical protein JCM8097_003994 [Rhodosporidiobolus ruineniae]
MTTAILGDDISSGAGWIAPYYAALLDKVHRGESPYLFMIDILEGLYTPSVPRGFRTQLAVVNGLFGLSIITLVAGLLVRVLTGRFWLFHRVDRVVILPNTSTLYSICSLAYTAMSMVMVVSAIRLAQNDPVPRYYIGIRAAWIAPLWSGIYCEYIRRNSPSYQDSRYMTALALLLPGLVLLVAFVPPTYFFLLAAVNFNSSYRTAASTIWLLEGWQADWTPQDGFDIAKLVELLQPGAKLATHLSDYSTYNRLGCAFCAAVLRSTFCVYIFGAWSDLNHLTSTISQLRPATKLVNPHRSRSSSATFLSTPSRSSSIRSKLAYVVAFSPSLDVPTSSNDTASSPVAFPFRQSDPRLFPPVCSADAEPTQQPWTLLVWVRQNRIWSVTCITAMLLVNAAVELWQALTPISFDKLQYPAPNGRCKYWSPAWAKASSVTKN